MSNPLTLVLVVTGLVICSKGRKRNDNILFKNGYFFFLLLFFSGLYSLIVPILLPKILLTSLIQRPELFNTIMSISKVPSIILNMTAFLLLISAFSRNIKSEAGEKTS